MPLWRFFTRRWKGLARGAARLDEALRRLLRRRGQVGAAFAWHLAGWFSHVVETWMVLALLGAPIGWREALVVESVTATLRAAAFFVPGGLGVQEATLLGICRHLGMPAEAALALGVCKRLREIVVGLPGIAAWAFSERGLGTGPAAVETRRS